MQWRHKQWWVIALFSVSSVFVLWRQSPSLPGAMSSHIKGVVGLGVGGEQHHLKHLNVKGTHQDNVNLAQATVGHGEITYETLTYPRTIVHLVRIPAEAAVTIRPVIVADGLAKVEPLAQQQGAIAAINGGFFDPNN
ncbi:MAG: hypothetical protein F6K16_42260, partial [Symploca sp. SIO2B6]|nr:hypothetical protein [Symploca sp. SIO2B6]